MSPLVAVVDYRMGNLFSLVSAIERFSVPVVVTASPVKLRQATHLVLPGDGAFRTGMDNLRRQKLIPVLEDCVLRMKRPFLGICIGMELLADRGTEDGECPGLGWVNGAVVRLSESADIRLPHIGWDDVSYRKDAALFRDIPQRADFYFLHSYHFSCRATRDIVATATYGTEFAAAIESGNIYGTQFHPEKSQKYGMKLLENFLKIDLQC